MTEGGQSLLLGAGDTAGIRKAPMYLTAGVGKERARLLRLVAHRYDQIHRRLGCKRLNAFGGLVADINAKLLHSFDREGMDGSRFDPSAQGKKGRPSTSTQ